MHGRRRLATVFLYEAFFWASCGRQGQCVLLRKAGCKWAGADSLPKQCPRAFRTVDIRFSPCRTHCSAGVDTVFNWSYIKRANNDFISKCGSQLTSECKRFLAWWEEGLHHYTAMRTWVYYLTTLNLSFLICKMGTVIMSTLQGCEEDWWAITAGKALRSVVGTLFVLDKCYLIFILVSVLRLSRTRYRILLQ